MLEVCYLFGNNLRYFFHLTIHFSYAIPYQLCILLWGEKYEKELIFSAIFSNNIWGSKTVSSCHKDKAEKFIMNRNHRTNCIKLLRFIILGDFFIYLHRVALEDQSFFLYLELYFSPETCCVSLLKWEHLILYYSVFFCHSFFEWWFSLYFCDCWLIGSYVSWKFWFRFLLVKVIYLPLSGKQRGREETTSVKLLNLKWKALSERES